MAPFRPTFSYLIFFVGDQVQFFSVSASKSITLMRSCSFQALADNTSTCTFYASNRRPCWFALFFFWRISKVLSRFLFSSISRAFCMLALFRSSSLIPPPCSQTSPYPCTSPFPHSSQDNSPARLHVDMACSAELSWEINGYPLAVGHVRESCVSESC